MSSPTLTRRALIAGAGTTIASAALAVPYVNAVRADEVCSLPVEATADRINRLVSELSAALDEEYGGEYEAVIGPHGAVSYRWAKPTPRQRAREAVADLRSSLSDMGHNQWMAAVRDGSGNFANVLIFDGHGSLVSELSIA